MCYNFYCTNFGEHKRRDAADSSVVLTVDFIAFCYICQYIIAVLNSTECGEGLSVLRYLMHHSPNEDYISLPKLGSI